MKDFYDRMNSQGLSHNHYQQFTKARDKDLSQENIERIVAEILCVLGKISKGTTEIISLSYPGIRDRFADLV
jgi:hypothetical protein